MAWVNDASIVQQLTDYKDELLIAFIFASMKLFYETLSLSSRELKYANEELWLWPSVTFTNSDRVNVKEAAGCTRRVESLLLVTSLLDLLSVM